MGENKWDAVSGIPLFVCVCVCIIYIYGIMMILHWNWGYPIGKDLGLDRTSQQDLLNSCETPTPTGQPSATHRSRINEGRSPIHPIQRPSGGETWGDLRKIREGQKVQSFWTIWSSYIYEILWVEACYIIFWLTLSYWWNVWNWLMQLIG